MCVMDQCDGKEHRSYFLIPKKILISLPLSLSLFPSPLFNDFFSHCNVSYVSVFLYFLFLGIIHTFLSDSKFVPQSFTKKNLTQNQLYTHSAILLKLVLWNKWWVMGDV